MDYAEEIRKARKKTGLSQDQVAQLVGLDRSNYNKIEKGRRNPSEKLFSEILDALGFTLEKKVKKKSVKT